MSLLQKYKKIERIGKGTFGVVYKAQDLSTGKYVAVKKIILKSTDEGVPATAIREIAILRDLFHPNIERLVDTIYSGKKLFLVFEFVKYDLIRFIESYTRKTHTDILDIKLTKSIMYQLLKGVAYCHVHGIIHRDVKPQNILIDEIGNVKLGDFGLSRTYSIPEHQYSHEIVTLWYRPPEVLLGASIYTTAVDVWSCGCVFAELLLGKPLFEGSTEIDMLYRIFNICGTPWNERTVANEQPQQPQQQTTTINPELFLAEPAPSESPIANASSDGPSPPPILLSQTLPTESTRSPLSLWADCDSLPNFSRAFPQWKRKDFASLFPQLPPEGIDLLNRMLICDPQQRISSVDTLNHPFFASIVQQEDGAIS